MKTQFAILLIFVVVGSSRAIENECANEKVGECMDQFMNAMAEDEASVEKTCKDLNDFVGCFRQVADECDLDDEDIQEEITKLEAMVDKDCQEGSDFSHNEVSIDEDEEKLKLDKYDVNEAIKTTDAEDEDSSDFDINRMMDVGYWILHRTRDLGSESSSESDVESEHMSVNVFFNGDRVETQPKVAESKPEADELKPKAADLHAVIEGEVRIKQSWDEDTDNIPNFKFQTDENGMHFGIEIPLKTFIDALKEEDYFSHEITEYLIDATFFEPQKMINDYIEDDQNEEDDGFEKRSSETKSDDEQCVVDNAAYISRCLQQGTEQAMTFFANLTRSVRTEYVGLHRDDYKNLLSCAIFSSISSCVVDRVNEMCGAEASETIFQDFMKQMPSDVLDACETVRQNPQLLDLLPQNGPQSSQLDQRRKK